MEQDNPANEQALRLNYSDQQSLTEEAEYEAEPPFQQPAGEVELLNKAEVGPIQIIYIMFSFYKKECDQLVQQYNCKIRFSINSYIIEQVGACSKQEFGICLKNAFEFMQSIQRTELKIQSYPNTKYKYCHSPYIKELLEKKKIKLTRFHNKVYGFSRQISEEAIKAELNQLLKNLLVHSICFRRIRRSIIQQNAWVLQIYNHIAQYCRLILEHYESYFKEREVIVTPTDENGHIVLHGTRGRNIMECKNTMKNVFESMVCLFIKNTEIDHKLMKKYLKKASLYPVYCSSYSQNMSVIISKDNILKQLISKSPNFMKYLGLEHPLEDLSQSDSLADSEATVGFYLIPSPKIDIKMQKIKEKCQSKCYDLYSHNGIKYFKKVFVQQGKERQHPYKELLIDLMLCVQQFKQKFQLLKAYKKEEEPRKEIDDGLKYQIISTKTAHQELKKQLKRDVLTEKLRMKKRYLIEYNIIESKEVPTYWIEEKDGTEGPQIKANELKKGSFFKGFKKINEKGEIFILLEELITIL